MSHNVHPYSFRLGISRDWKSRWFFRSSYAKFLKEDIILREWLSKRLKTFMIESIDIERSPRELHLIIHTPRPGLLIGRAGEGIEKLRREVMTKVVEISQPTNSQLPAIKLSVEEIRSPESNARVVARMIVQDLEKRLPFRRVLKQVVSKVMGANSVSGVKIALKGRLDGSEMGRREWMKEGRIPLQTLRSDIDFAKDTANLPYGTIGVKVWIYKGEIFADDKKEKTSQN